MNELNYYLKRSLIFVFAGLWKEALKTGSLLMCLRVISSGDFEFSCLQSGSYQMSENRKLMRITYGQQEHILAVFLAIL